MEFQVYKRNKKGSGGLETVFQADSPVYLKIPGSDTRLKLKMTQEGLEITSTDEGLCIIPCVSNSVIIKLKK